MRPKNGNPVNSTQFRHIVRFLERFGAAIAAIRVEEDAFQPGVCFPRTGLRRSLTVNPQKHRTQSRAVGAIEQRPAAALGRDQAGLPQHTEVEGKRGPGHRERLSQLCRAQFAAAK